MKKTGSKKKVINHKVKKLVKKVAKVTKIPKIKAKSMVKNKVKTKIKAQTKKKTKAKVSVRVKAPVKIVKKTKIKTKAPAKVVIKAKAGAKAKGKIKAKTKVLVKAVSKAKTAVKAVAKAKVKAVVKDVTKKKLTTETKKNVLGPADITPYQSKQNEEYMNDEQLEHFRTVLLQWKEQLMAEVDRTMHHMQDESSNYPDPVDRASQEEEFNLELRARDRERKLLRKIEETLNRINDRDYGYCDDCGAEIGIRRLEARPTAAQCIECKTISEIREKQIGEGT